MIDLADNMNLPSDMGDALKGPILRRAVVAEHRTPQPLSSRSVAVCTAWFKDLISQWEIYEVRPVN